MSGEAELLEIYPFDLLCAFGGLSLIPLHLDGIQESIIIYHEESFMIFLPLFQHGTQLFLNTRELFLQMLFQGLVLQQLASTITKTCGIITFSLDRGNISHKR